MALLGSWPEIAGQALAETSMPLKMKWPRRASESDDFQPGTLIIAAEGMAALHIQHQTGELIQRVNAFMGYRAIDRNRIEQKPVAKAAPKKPQRPVSQRKLRHVEELAAGFEDEALRESIRRLGERVIRDKG